MNRKAKSDSLSSLKQKKSFNRKRFLELAEEVKKIFKEEKNYLEEQERQETNSDHFCTKFLHFS